MLVSLPTFIVRMAGFTISRDSSTVVATTGKSGSLLKGIAADARSMRNVKTTCTSRRDLLAAGDANRRRNTVDADDDAADGGGDDGEGD